MTSVTRAALRLLTVLFLSLGLLSPVGAQAAPTPDGTPPDILAAESSGGTIRGTVLDHNGSPLEAGWVDLYSQDEEFLQDTELDETGEYSFTDLPPGVYFLNAYGYSGDLWFEGWFDGADSFAGALPVVVGDDAGVVSADFSIIPDEEEDRERGDASIQGLVKGSNGKPLSGVEIHLDRTGGPNDDDFEWFDEYTLTDDKGRYAFSELPGGTYDLSFTHAAHLTKDIVDVKVSGTQVKKLDVQLQAAGSIGGKVTDSKGKPLAGAIVTIFERDSSWDEWFSTDEGAESDAQGNYVVTGLKPGNYRVLVEHAAGAYEFAQDKVRVQQAKDQKVSSGKRTSVNVKLGAPGTITGQLVGLGVDPDLSDLELVARDRDGRTRGYADFDESGSFSITGLATGRYVLCVFSESEFIESCWDDVAPRTGPVTVASGRTTAGVEVPVVRSGRLEIEVSEAVGDALVHLYRRSGESWVHAGQHDVEDERYERDGGESDESLVVPFGTYRVKLVDTEGLVAPSWHGPATSLADAADVVVEAGGRATAGDFAPSESDVTITGAVTLNGIPAVDAWVDVARLDESGARPAWLDAAFAQVTDGSYRVGNLEPGVYRVCAWAYDEATDEGAHECRTTDGAIEGETQSDFALALVTTTMKEIALVKRPAIKGTAVAGATLSADTGSWKPKPKSFTYQWYVDAEPVDGATKSTFPVSFAYVGQQIWLEVTPVLAGHRGHPGYSDPSDWVVAGKPFKASGIVVNHSTSTTKQIAWSISDGATSYRVEHREGKKGKAKKLTLDTPALSLTGLKANTEYQVRVEAVNAQGGSGFTGWTSIGKTVAGPATPTFGKALEPGLRTITIDWTDSARATGYTAHWRKGTKGAYTPITGLTESRAEVEGLEPATQYEFYVTAHDADGVVSTSKKIKLSTAKTATPASVTAELGTTTAEVAWEPVADATGYRVLVKVGKNGKVTTTKVGDVSSIALKGLKANSDTWIQVASVAPNGTVGGASAWKSFGKTAAMLKAPVLPKQASVQAGHLEVSWSSVPGAAGYRLFGRMNGKGAFEAIDVDGTSYAGPAASAISAEFYVVALSPDGTPSPASARQTYKATAPSLVAPSGLTHSAYRASNWLSLEWNAVSGATGYDLRYRVAGTDAWSEVSTFGASDFHSIYGLDADTEYEVAVRTVKGGERSAWSSSITLRTLDEEVMAG